MLSVGKSITLLTCTQVLNRLLRTHAAKGDIAEMEDEMTLFSESPSKTSSQYDKELVAEDLRCADENEEHEPNELFIKELNKFTYDSITNYCASLK